MAALGLRLKDMGDYPPRHATDDEFHYLWAGLNFWADGKPASWSGLSGGAKFQVGIAQMDKMGYVIVSPAFDHPPLFTLLVGAAAHLFHPIRLDQVMQDGRKVTIWNIDLHEARWMMVPLFIAAFWLLYGVTRSAFTPDVALFTILFYGFMSHAVTQGRLILADNLSTVLLLANVFVIQQWLSGKISHRAMAGLTITLTAAAVLTKVPAICHAPALIALLIMTKRPREMRYVFYGIGIGIAVYLGWICWFGMPGFLDVMKSQADRFRGFNAFQLMSGVPRLLDVQDLNGVLIAAWFCLVVQAMRPRASPLFVIAPVYTLAFTFFAGDFLFGWYSLPLFPWLAMALGLTTAQVYARPPSTMMIAWFLLLLPHAFQTIYIARYDLQTPLRIAYMLVVAGLIFSFLLPKVRAQKVFRMAILIIVAVVLLREVYEVVNRRADRLRDDEKYLMKG